MLTASVFQGLAANLGFCACVLYVTRHSTLTRLAQKFGACSKRGIVIVSAEFGSKQNQEMEPWFIVAEYELAATAKVYGYVCF